MRLRRKQNGVLQMIGFVCGIAGSGKTRRMVDMANAILNDSLGKIVFIDEDCDRMFDLKHAIRLVDVGGIQRTQKR